MNGDGDVCEKCVFFRHRSDLKGAGECFVEPPRVVVDQADGELMTMPPPDVSGDRPACRFFRSRFSA